MGRKRFVSLCLALAASMFVGLTAVPAASADPTPWGFYSTRVVRISKYGNQVNFNNVLGKVYLPVGQTATISAGKSATRTIQVSLGYSRGGVAASLGISSSSTVTITVSCAVKVRAGRKYVAAFPVGDQIFYRIEEYWTDRDTRKQYVTKSSGTLMAFNPYPSQMYCYDY